MSAAPDDLEKLLTDVRKTIHENQLFLRALVDDDMNDAVDSTDEQDNNEGSKKDPEEFEEL